MGHSVKREGKISEARSISDRKSGMKKTIRKAFEIDLTKTNSIISRSYSEINIVVFPY